MKTTERIPSLAQQYTKATLTRSPANAAPPMTSPVSAQIPRLERLAFVATSGASNVATCPNARRHIFETQHLSQQRATQVLPMEITYRTHPVAQPSADVYIKRE